MPAADKRIGLVGIMVGFLLTFTTGVLVGQMVTTRPTTTNPGSVMQTPGLVWVAGSMSLLISIISLHLFSQGVRGQTRQDQERHSGTAIPIAH